MATVGQNILSFKLKLDKIDSQAYPDINPQEIRYWLDEAADRFVKQRYGRNNIKLKGFEESQKRIDDLRQAVVTEDVAAAVFPIYTNAYSSVIPACYRYLLKLMVQVEYVDCNGDTVTTWSTPKQVQQDDVNALLEDPFNKPTVERPLVTFERDNLLVYTDGVFTILQTKMTYLRLFRKLQLGVVNCDGSSDVYQDTTLEYTELAPDVHEEIVDIAVKMALENIESQRYQTNSNEITGTE